MKNTCFKTTIRLLAVLGLTACALPDGEAWQQAELEVNAVFEVNGRIQENGRFKTSKSYEIAFESVEITGLGFRTEALSSSTPLEIFDPSNPPEGYNLCHNGHCHNENNELIDYQDIQEELNQASGAAANSLFQGLNNPISFGSFESDQSQRLSLGPCTDPYQVCDLGADAQVAKVVFEPLGASVSMRVYHDGTLPEEGLELTRFVNFETPISLTLSSPPSLENGTLGINLLIDKSLWDSIDFVLATELNPTNDTTEWVEAELNSLLVEAFSQHLTLQTTPSP